MANLTPLRNIHLSGGLFTENLLLKIRDKKDIISEVQWISFGEKEEKKRYYEVWDWAKRLFGDITNKLDTWTVEDRFEKWIKPLLQQLGHESEPKPSIDLTKLSDEEQDNILNKIQISHQLKNHAKIGLHICENDNFDERNDTNYQKKSQHDHFQRYILLNEGVRWGILSNGKYIRLLGEYSNIYAKGYIQFNLDSIFVNKDESEFWVFYALFHHSRFSQTYGLNPNDWINKLKKKGKNLSKKLGSDEASKVIDEDILKIYFRTLNEFINKAIDNGVMAIRTSDSEFFLQNLKKEGLDLGEVGRDFYLKELESVIININENLSIIQKLQKQSQEEGIEAGKKLRGNVKKALELMGEGLISSSKAFIQDLLKGNIEIKDYYQELLRITYRLIFILYAEAKDLLPGVATIYYNDLGLTFLRKKALQPIRDDQNIDLWHRLLLLFKYLDIGESSIGINAFSGELFNSEKIPFILDLRYNLSLPNSILLKIIYELTIVDLGIGLQSIDYSEIGEEEIGGIYEALLDFQPKYIKQDSLSYHFLLDEIDSERKGSGTYYTSKGLIDILLKTSLKPIIENKLKTKKNREDKLNALLELKICDPACGGGSFLLATIDYLGKTYAQINTGQEYPDDISLRKARRKILQNCIYGVDLNPMALDLAKISLWLKASVGNKPLTFLDNHFKVGNSLIGFIKKQLIEKIPIKAFNAIKGNVRTGISDENSSLIIDVKKRLKNFSIDKSEGKSLVQTTLFPYKDSERYSRIAYEVFRMEEDNIIQLQEKMKCYIELLKSNSWNNLNLQSNLWTASFFWNFSENFIKDTPTDALILKAKQEGINENNLTTKETNRLSSKYKFFNWFLEFPEVFQRKQPGFDCILMNPPWDVLTLKEMEFFAGKSDEVINSQNQAERRKKIKELTKTDPQLHLDYINAYRTIKKISYYIKNSNFYKFSTKGSINLFANFIERSRLLLNNSGKIGCIVPTTLLTGDNLSIFFDELVKTNSLDSAYNFINRLKIFPIGDKIQFSLITISQPQGFKKEILMSFYTWNPIKLQKSIENYENNIEEDEFNRKIEEGGSILSLERSDFDLFNPNTRTTPLFRRRIDYKLVKQAYLKSPVLINKSKKRENNYWNISLGNHFHQSNHASLFLTKDDLKKIDAKKEKIEAHGGVWVKKDINHNLMQRFLPLYSGSSIWFYDHRFNDIIPRKDKSLKKKGQQINVTEKDHRNPSYFHMPMYWIDEEHIQNIFPDYWKNKWFITYRSISGTDNARTFIVSAVPFYPNVNSLTTIYLREFKKEIICLLCNFSSIFFDYIVRNKISGMNLSQYIVEQLPAFTSDNYNNKLFNEICSRAIKLIYTSWDMQNFAIDLGLPKEQEPFEWNLLERENIKAEIDIIFALMYGYEINEIEYILDTFSRLRVNELRKYGEYRTKKLILNAYKKIISDPKIIKSIIRGE